jgi:hypothetical protein
VSLTYVYMPRARPSAYALLYAEGKAVGVWPGSGSLADDMCPAMPRARLLAYGLAPLDLTLAPRGLGQGLVRQGPLEPSAQDPYTEGHLTSADGCLRR